MKRIAALLFFMMMLTSCTKKDVFNFPEDILIPKEGFNKSFVLEDIASYNNKIKENELITLYAKNLSNEPIVFENDYQISIYSKNENVWNEINNSFSYANGNVVLPISKNEYDGINIFCFPSSDENEFIGELYIFIYGTKSNEIIGAYFSSPIPEN